jgi:hypothetical protein
MAPGFNDVKAILDKIIADWTAGTGREPDLLDQHSTDTFDWDTKADLLNSTAKGNHLIQASGPGQGAASNLVVALTAGVPKGQPGQRWPKMPNGGLNGSNNQYLTLASPEIKTIIAWIEAGCPD